MLHDQLAHVVADRLGVPTRAAQQPLHRIRAGVPGLLSQRPATLILHVGQQAKHERPRGTPRLDPHEPARDPAHRLVE